MTDMELETINKLYLELSQVATATTGNEERLHKGIGDARSIAMQIQFEIAKSKGGPRDKLKQVEKMASRLEFLLNDLLP